jgi:hypothetical protein
MLTRLVLLLLPGVLAAQSPEAVLRERGEYLAWLGSAPNSPLAALARQPIGAGISLGPSNADVPLAGLSEHRLRERGGTVLLEGPEGSRALPPGGPSAMGSYTVSVDGPPGLRVVTVYGPVQHAKRVEHYPYHPELVFTGPLLSPPQRATVRVLSVDGIESDAAEAGRVVLQLNGRTVRLLVRRFGDPSEEESELEIYFRDETNGHGTYPAGRFVSLLPAGNGRYRLDFNRARNPFCAYSSVYPCPAPWRGNAIPVPIAAGERYAGEDSAGPAGVPKQ